MMIWANTYTPSLGYHSSNSKDTFARARQLLTDIRGAIRLLRRCFSTEQKWRICTASPLPLPRVVVVLAKCQVRGKSGEKNFPLSVRARVGKGGKRGREIPQHGATCAYTRNERQIFINYISSRMCPCLYIINARFKDFPVDDKRYSSRLRRYTDAEARRSAKKSNDGYIDKRKNEGIRIKLF